MSPRVAVRLALGWLAVTSLQVGGWALIAPRSFYDGFPGLGRSWVSADGPYNEHLVRDVGALNLALAVLLVAAMFWLTYELIVVAAAATSMWNVPHFVYHLTATDDLGTADRVAASAGLAVSVVVAAMLIVLARPLRTPRSIPHSRRRTDRWES